MSSLGGLSTSICCSSSPFAFFSSIGSSLLGYFSALRGSSLFLAGGPPGAFDVQAGKDACCFAGCLSPPGPGGGANAGLWRRDGRGAGTAADAGSFTGPSAAVDAAAARVTGAGAAAGAGAIGAAAGAGSGAASAGAAAGAAAAGAGAGVADGTASGATTDGAATGAISSSSIGVVGEGICTPDSSSLASPGNSFPIGLSSTSVAVSLEESSSDSAGGGGSGGAGGGPGGVS